MPATRSLRRLTAARFQVLINDLVAAVLHVTPAGVDVFIEADTVRLLVSVKGTVADVARRLAEGEFDDDFRFEIYPWDEPEMGCTHTLVQIATPSQIEVERFTTDDPYGNIEAAREAQAIPFEERMAIYADRGL